MAEDRFGVIDSHEDAVRPRPTDSQRGQVLMPSDLSGPPGTGPCITTKMTPEERETYRPDPTKAELQADRAAGLRAPEIARKWGITLDRTWTLIRYYGLYVGPAKTAAPAEAKRSLRQQIKAKLAQQGSEKMPQKKSPVRETLTREVLAEEIQKRSAYAIGKHYGCSDMSVRKWLKEYGLTNPRAHVETSEKPSPAPAGLPAETPPPEPEPPTAPNISPTTRVPWAGRKTQAAVAAREIHGRDAEEAQAPKPVLTVDRYDLQLDDDQFRLTWTARAPGSKAGERLTRIADLLQVSATKLFEVTIQVREVAPGG